MAKYKFTGGEGGPIDRETAERWIKRYQDGHAGKTKAHFFGEKIIKEILNGPGCKGIRIYYARNEDDGHELILMGADENGQNIWPDNSAGKGGGGGLIADQSSKCPPYC